MQTRINQISKQIADLLKKENDEKQKQNRVNGEINNLVKRSTQTKNLSSIQNYERQANTKRKELRIEKKIRLMIFSIYLIDLLPRYK